MSLEATCSLDYYLQFFKQPRDPTVSYLEDLMEFSTHLNELNRENRTLTDEQLLHLVARTAHYASKLLHEHVTLFEKLRDKKWILDLSEKIGVLLKKPLLKEEQQQIFKKISERLIALEKALFPNEARSSTISKGKKQKVTHQKGSLPAYNHRSGYV